MDDQTTDIQGYVDRLREGDEAARAALLDCACDRLARLARKMLRDFPGVGRWEQSGDVLQNALIRLDRALRSTVPPTTADFFRLASAQIRRELIDLARHYGGPEGAGANHSTCADTSRLAGRLDQATDRTNDPSRLLDWTELHRTIEVMGPEDREVFDLLWYQGLTQAEAARILGLSERQVNRRWMAARLRLADALGGHLPI